MIRKWGSELPCRQALDVTVDGVECIEDDGVMGTADDDSKSEPVDAPAPVIGNQGEDMDDAIVPKVAARFYTPTKFKFQAHEATHLPYCNRRAHCVAGKGVSSPHKTSSESERIGITTRIDYCFINDEVKEGTPPVLVVWGDGHRALWALPVSKKGPVDYVVI